MLSHYVSCWIGFLVIALVAWAFFCGTYSAHRDSPKHQRRDPAMLAELVLYAVAGSIAFVISCCCFHICMKHDKHVFSLFVQDLCEGVRDTPRGSGGRG